MISIANAPVSYGVFELSRPDLVALPTGDEIAQWVSEAGYTGIDLGPVGLLGRGPELVDVLHRHRLALAGGWVDMPFAGPQDDFDGALRQLDSILDVFAAAADVATGFAPLPTLADSGDAMRRAHPGGGARFSLRGDAWERFAQRVRQVTARVRARGLEPTFHHHACTYVETPDEVDALLASTDIGLTFDSGHLLIGGGDPVEDFLRWQKRINHIHLKDAKVSVLHDALTASDPMREIWERRIFVPLGDGDLDIDGLVRDILDSGYNGWLIVEQDVVILSEKDRERAQHDQIVNREYLRRWFS